MSSLEKIQPSFDSFQIWCAKHLPLEDLSNETILQERKRTIKIECILEFRSDKEYQSFLQQYNNDWQNPLNPQQISSENYNYHQILSSNPKADYIFITKYIQLPLLWIQATYQWIEQILQDERIKFIHGNKPMYLCLNEVNQFFEIEQVHKSFYGFSGKNVSIGLIDTGIDQTHPDLKDKVVEVINITEEESTDLNGHGTILASIIAGTGVASNRLYHGIAPNANLFDIKVSNQFGYSTVADVISAIDFLLTRSPRVLPQIIVFGCVSAYIPTKFDPLIQYCLLLTEANVLVIAPIGNYGPDYRYIGSPALSEEVISVGTIDLESKIAFFSSRGFISGSPMKPNFVAPGIKIVAAKALNGKIGQPYSPNDNYSINSGTSISAGVIAGICALLIEAFPSFTMKEIFNQLNSSGESVNKSDNLPSIRIPNIMKILYSSNLMYKRPIPYRELMNNAKWGTLLVIIILIMLYILISFLS